MTSHPRPLRRLVVTTALLATGAGLSGCGGETSSTATSTSPSVAAASSASTTDALGPTRLTIVTRDTAAGSALTHTLTCNPTGGTLHDPAAACAQLAAAGGAGALHLDSDRMCTQQIAGPARATITGTIAGRKVNAALSQSDGCRIAQWNSLSRLLGSRAGD